MVNSYKDLESVIEDKDGLMNEELQNMRGQNVFNTFYETLKATREYHNRYPGLPLENLPKFDDIVCDIPFSGEEIYGKYLDLHSFYLRFVNLPNLPSRNQDYLQYLDKFNSFFYVPEACKKTKLYAEYLADLFNYFSGFLHRTQPLIELEESLVSWKSIFDEKWKDNRVLGWDTSKNKSSYKKTTGAPQPLRLGMFNSVEELEALGLERLKQGLEAMNLKCGGTLRERALRLWTVRGKKWDDIPDKLKAKKTDPANEESRDTGVNNGDENAHNKEVMGSFKFCLPLTLSATVLV